MSLEQIKAELATMSPEDQRHLSAYLVHLRHQRDPSAVAGGETDPSKWISVEELKEKWKG